MKLSKCPFERLPLERLAEWIEPHLYCYGGVTMVADDKAGERQAGSLFDLRTEVCGQPENRFRIGP